MNQNDPILQTVSLVNFPFLTKESLARLAKEEQLAMDILGLQLCQEYYRSQKRDPSRDELHLLDTVVADGYRSADSLLISQFTTESTTVAETFADLLGRRSGAARISDKPLSLAALAQLMENWLADRAKRERPEADVGIRFSPYRDLLLAADGYCRTASSGNREDDISIGSRARSYKGECKLSAGDYIYGVFASESNEAYDLQTIATYLATPAVTQNAKVIKIAEARTLLPLLTELSCGLTLNAEKVTEGEETLLSALNCPRRGAILVASPERSADLLLEAQDAELRVLLLGKVTAEETVSIPREKGAVRFPLPFLRSLIFARLYSATVANPADGNFRMALSRIGTCTLGGKRNAVIKVDADGTSPFREALMSVVYALSHCVAAGADIRDVKLASYLTLPRNHVGDALGTVLGLYRAQAEFELYGGCPVLVMSDKDSTAISAVTVVPLHDETPSSTVVGDGSSIYYLEPLYTDDGIPDFADLKKMYAYISALMADGKVLSIRPTGEDLLADLSDMSGEKTVEYLAGSPLSPHFGGFLVETNDAIQGVLVGKTEKNEAALDI